MWFFKICFFNHFYILCILSAHSTCLVKIFAAVKKWIIQCLWGSGRQTLFYATSENRHFYNLAEVMWRKNNGSMFIIVRDYVSLSRPTLPVPVSFNSLEWKVLVTDTFLSLHTCFCLWIMQGFIPQDNPESVMDPRARISSQPAP